MPIELYPMSLSLEYQFLQHRHPKKQVAPLKKENQLQYRPIFRELHSKLP